MREPYTVPMINTARPLPPHSADLRGVTVTAYRYRAEAVPAWGVAQRRRRNGQRLAALMRRRAHVRLALTAAGGAIFAAVAALCFTA